MSATANHPLSAMIRKLELWQPLLAAEQEAILALPHACRDLHAGQYLVWDGDRPQHTCVLLDGFAHRHKIGGNGGRQILSIHMKGDIVDLQNSLLGIADHNVQMLTAGKVALVPVEAMRDLASTHPAIGMAMWYETLVEGSIFREWILNIGRRDARTRIAHLLCEFAVRMEAAELGDVSTYELPITQEQLADAVALTAVHVNRTLMRLEEDGLISRTKRVITIHDWPELAKTADFQPRYLHLGLDGPPPGAAGANEFRPSAQ
jgi:CRP-like cAMP-binding protein